MFQRSNDEFPITKKKNSNRGRRDAIASSHSAFEINLQYVDSVFHNPLPTERRLIGKFWMELVRTDLGSGLGRR